MAGSTDGSIDIWIYGQIDSKDKGMDDGRKDREMDSQLYREIWLNCGNLQKVWQYRPCIDHCTMHRRHKLKGIGPGPWYTFTFLLVRFYTFYFIHRSFLHYSSLHCSTYNCSFLISSFLQCSFLHCSSLHCSFLISSFLQCSFLHCSSLHCSFLLSSFLQCSF